MAREEVTALDPKLWREVQAQMPDGKVEAIVEDYQRRGGFFKKPQPVTPESDMHVEKTQGLLEKAEKEAAKWGGMPPSGLLQLAHVYATLALVAAIKEQGKPDCCLNKPFRPIETMNIIGISGDREAPKQAIEKMLDQMTEGIKRGG